MTPSDTGRSFCIGHFPLLPHQQQVSSFPLLFLSCCRFLWSKPCPQLGQRVQSCSQHETAALTPDLDLILPRHFLLVPLSIATSPNPAVIFPALQLARPFFSFPRGCTEQFVAADTGLEARRQTHFTRRPTPETQLSLPLLKTFLLQRSVS